MPGRYGQDTGRVGISLEEAVRRWRASGLVSMNRAGIYVTGRLFGGGELEQLLAAVDRGDSVHDSKHADLVPRLRELLHRPEAAA